jgi:hypothetical protein
VVVVVELEVMQQEQAHVQVITAAVILFLVLQVNLIPDAAVVAEPPLIEVGLADLEF